MVTARARDQAKVPQRIGILEIRVNDLLGILQGAFIQPQLIDFGDVFLCLSHLWQGAVWTSI